MSDPSTVNFEHSLHIILLLIFQNSNKSMQFGTEKQYFKKTSRTCFIAKAAFAWVFEQSDYFRL